MRRGKRHVIPQREPETMVGTLRSTPPRIRLRWGAGNAATTKTTIGGVCSGLGIGSIQTTFFSNAAKRFQNLDSTSNPACTNDGAAGGAAGYW